MDVVKEYEEQEVFEPIEGRGYPGRKLDYTEGA